jgi:hypothetical protein
MKQRVPGSHAAGHPGRLRFDGLEDSQVGLRKTSVFDVVTPRPFGFDSPGAALTIPPLPGSGMPPMISHTVDEYLPLTAKANECLDCHDKPDRIGKPVASGKARPRPANHYVSRGRCAGLAGANTTAWPATRHRPSGAAVPALVRNTSQ